LTYKFSRYLILAACFGAISMFPAAADTLESLLGVPESGGLQVGDVVFYDFGFSASCSGGTGGAATTSCSQLVSDGLITGISSDINPGSLSIVPDTANGLDGFSLQGTLKTISDGTTATTLDIGLTYDAAIVASSNTINGMLLGATAGFNPLPALPGPSLGIEETVDNLNGGGFLTSLQVTDPPPSLAASAPILLAGVTGVEVTKDIDLDSGAGSSGGVGDFANSTTISQQLSQVPEPRAYAAVMGLFFALFFVIKRRREQTA
jgi:hypothetical protein